MQEHELAQLLHAAAEADFGIAVETNAPERLRLLLYPVLKKTELSLSLQIVNQDLWIVRKEYLPTPTRPGKGLTNA